MLFIFQDSQINRKLKRTAFLFEIEIFLNRINVVTVTFDPFKASLMNKSIFLMVVYHSFNKNIVHHNIDDNQKYFLSSISVYYYDF